MKFNFVSHRLNCYLKLVDVIEDYCEICRNRLST